MHNLFGFYQLNYASGYLNYSGNYSNNPASSSGTGSGYADLLLGLPALGAKGSLPGGVPYLDYTEYGGFVNDEWRATNRLTG